MLPVAVELFYLVVGILSNGLTILAEPNQDILAMEKEKVVPDVIDTIPQEALMVRFGNLPVNMGNILTPTQVQQPPNVAWRSEPGKFYVLCMTDPDDLPSRKTPAIREWHHWLVGNIKDNEIATGDVLSQFISSGPPSGTGLHRYVFLVYEQPGKLNFDEKRLPNTSDNGRDNFSIRNFANKYNLGQPIAGNFYQAEWDDYVPKLQQKLRGM